jgi:predicted MPP superfamily phosphohydrolase
MVVLVAALLTVLLLLVLDVYLYQPVRVVTSHQQTAVKLALRGAYWMVSFILLAVVVVFYAAGPNYWGITARNWMMTALVMVYLSKIIGGVVVLIDDVQRFARKIAAGIRRKDTPAGNGKKIPRSEFLSKAAVLTAAVPFGTMAFGILSGAHDYRIRRATIYLPNLPKAFDGIRIGQISDIHSGSFFNKTAVKGGVEMMLNEHPDVLFFTGDLVNNQTDEVKEYLPIFSKLKAPLGVFSVTGNHDYGNYRSWPSRAAKKKNFEDLLEAHRIMGFDLLMNENRFIEADGERLAVIGVENWGTGRFPRYGDLAKAYSGAQEAAVKLLLSHDPSHWDAQVRIDYPDIDIMFAGHTHGFQFGIEWGDIRWSPSQYVYEQWAGLYRKGSQYLYVNRGFGFIGYPGRIGIPPELTIIELKRA